MFYLKVDFSRFERQYKNQIGLDEKLRSLGVKKVEQLFPLGKQKTYAIGVLGQRLPLHQTVLTLRTINDQTDEQAVLFGDDYDGVFAVRQVFFLANGHPSAHERVVDAVLLAPYEHLPGYENALQGISGESMAKYLNDQLQAWRDYVDWMEKVVAQQAIGIRYTHYDYDTTTNTLRFRCVFKDKAHLDISRIILNSDDLRAFKITREDFDFAPGRNDYGITIGYFNRMEKLSITDPFRSIEQPLWFEIEIASYDEEPKHLPEQGFIASSLAGELALFSRWKSEIKSVSNYRSQSPYLSAWLFNAKNARKPIADHPIDFISSDLNPDQKAAVTKMMQAPDLALVQGPPGTGKTTVIAECLALLARANKTAMITSQTHAAVDNAMSRLPAFPWLRPIRFSKRDQDRVDNPYLMEHALWTWFDHLSDHLDEIMGQKVVMPPSGLSLEERERLIKEIDQIEVAMVQGDTSLLPRWRVLKNRLKDDGNTSDGDHQTDDDGQPSFSNDIMTILTRFSKHLREHRARDMESIFPHYMRHSNVVGVTCNESRKTLEDNGYAHFDAVIIDEVSKATPVEMLMGMGISKKTILVGDHRQLPPMFKSWGNMTMKEASEEGYSLFDRDTIARYQHMVESSLFKKLYKQADDSIKQALFTQHRMHDDIMQTVNYFYEGRLKSMSPERRHGIIIPGLINEHCHILWVDSSSGFEKWIAGGGRTNPLEASMIAKLVWRLEQVAKAGDFKIKGMVVTFYAAQRRLVRQSIQKIQSKAGGFKHSTWAVDTVERHQGKEADVVLVSMTRNPGKGGISAKGNMAQFERVNVALSRAKSLLVIFGARSALEDYPVMMDAMADDAPAQTVCVYGKIIEDIQRMGGFVTESAFLEAMGEIF